MCRNDNLTADYNNRSMYIWHNVDEILPFIIFSVKRKIPEFVNCIGRYLPSTVFGMLVIYCLKDVQFLQGNYGISKMISILVITILHVWKRNMLISIPGGTICYMVLIQLVF